MTNDFIERDWLGWTCFVCMDGVFQLHGVAWDVDNIWCPRCGLDIPRFLSKSEVIRYIDEHKDKDFNDNSLS